MQNVEIRKFKKVLVANRGEIAIRVYRALNELGIQTVGIFSKEDKYALFRTKTDEAYMLNPEKGPLDADDLADLADWYAMHRKNSQATEVVEYGLSLHPGSTPAAMLTSRAEWTVFSTSSAWRAP